LISLKRTSFFVTYIHCVDPEDDAEWVNCDAPRYEYLTMRQMDLNWRQLNAACRWERYREVAEGSLSAIKVEGYNGEFGPPFIEADDGDFTDNENNYCFGLPVVADD
jgi:hypothetical protein